MTLLFVIWATLYTYYLADTWPGNKQEDRPKPEAGAAPTPLPDFEREGVKIDVGTKTTEWEKVKYSK